MTPRTAGLVLGVVVWVAATSSGCTCASNNPAPAPVASTGSTSVKAGPVRVPVGILPQNGGTAPAPSAGAGNDPR
jgi:hypothetical protein